MRHNPLKLVISLCLVLATIVIYWQVLNHDFVNFDDDIYVTQNPRVQMGLTPQSLSWAFTTTDAEFWHPLTWISHMLDCQLYGLHPGWHHLTNLLLHTANTLLLFLVLEWMTGALWRSAFVAALFSLHPLHVESVAWVAERKDVLSTLFWMLTMAAYVYYTKVPSLKRYVLVPVAFGLGLMAKPMLVTLPFVLLLLDYWPLRRLEKKQGASISRLILEKVPLFALTILFCVVTFFAQQEGGLLPSLEGLPLKDRLANVLVSYVGYMGKMVWPRDLAVYYHLPEAAATWKALVSALFLGFLSILAVWGRKGRPYLAVGWLWYLGTLVPVIGLVQIATFTMADRYTYVTLIGLFIMIAWTVPDLLEGWKYGKGVLLMSAATVLSIFMACTWFQVRHWEDSISLWRHTVKITDSSYSAYNSLGAAFLEQGRLDEAAANIREALRIRPDYGDAHGNMGLVLMGQGSLNGAVAHFAKALEITPDDPQVHSNLGVALADQGHMDKAIVHYSEALRLNPRFAEAHNNMGRALVRQGHLDEAIGHYSKALEIKPRLIEAHNNMGIALVRLGRLDEAIDAFSNALRMAPENTQVRNNLRRTLGMVGKTEM